MGRLGPYRVLKQLGVGGMGIVYKAEDISLQRPVALKVMRPDRAADPEARQRFLREARATAALKHAHIVTIYQVGEDRGVPFFAMEYLRGQPLDTWLEHGHRATIPQVLRLGRELARALAAAHERGLIHRDIKPANIWLEAPHGRAKILDFGLAFQTHEPGRLTQSNVIVGSPGYMAPEQAHAAAVDARTDLFSLGCVLYHLCTGVAPFQGPSAVALLLAVVMETPQSVRELNPDVPPALATLIHQLLAKDPVHRPASAQAVLTALQAIRGPQASAAGIPVTIPLAPPDSPERPTGRTDVWLERMAEASPLAAELQVRATRRGLRLSRRMSRGGGEGWLALGITAGVVGLLFLIGFLIHHHQEGRKAPAVLPPSSRPAWLPEDGRPAPR
jgi:serine/threonine protein kinase